MPRQVTSKVRKWQIVNPEAYQAMIQVGRALKAGRLVRPAHCQICGAQTRVIAQHRDYSRPLEVVWVCYLCRYRHKLDVLGEPIPLRRSPVGRAPAPRPSLAPSPACAGWTRRHRPCQLSGRYRGADGRYYCGHHLRRVHRRRRSS